MTTPAPLTPAELDRLEHELSCMAPCGGCAAVEDGEANRCGLHEGWSKADMRRLLAEHRALGQIADRLAGERDEQAERAFAAEARVQELERDHERMRDRYNRSQTVAILDERDRLAERLVQAERLLRNMLLSADASWEYPASGHDWPDACAKARAFLSEVSNAR